MHQSVRMVCASFLVEYLGVSWVEGALQPSVRGCNPLSAAAPLCESLQPCVREAATLGVEPATLCTRGCSPVCACERLPPHAALRTAPPPGARWFHATLVDADVAINAMMWQNAGRSGIDQVSE